MRTLDEILNNEKYGIIARYLRRQCIYKNPGLRDMLRCLE